MSVPLVTRILLADDHTVVRHGLRMVLDSAPDLKVVAEAAKQLKAADPKEAAKARQRLEQWRGDPVLAAVREAKALERLPQEDRPAWRELWAEVERLLETGK